MMSLILTRWLSVRNRENEPSLELMAQYMLRSSPSDPSDWQRMAIVAVSEADRTVSVSSGGNPENDIEPRIFFISGGTVEF